MYNIQKIEFEDNVLNIGFLYYREQTNLLIH